MGLYKRGQVWWIRFTFKGKRAYKSTGVTDKKLAEKIHHKIMNQIGEGRWFDCIEGASKTVGDLLDKYIEEHATPNKQPGTVKADKTMVKEMKTFFGDAFLKDITPKSVSDYKTYCRGKGLSATSINHRRSLLNHAFNLALKEWEWVSENPMVRVRPEKVNNARDRWLTIEEEQTLLGNCTLHPTLKGNAVGERLWLREVVLFALNTGMRQDEILSLEWPHVDLSRRTATVVRSKNGEKRTVPLNRTALDLLASKSKVRGIRSNYIFMNELGVKIGRRNLLRAFYNVVERAKIDDFRFHDLRHTFATRLAQAGIDLYTIAKLLGHRDIKMAQRYSHHCPESLRVGVEALDRTGTISGQCNEKGATQIA